MSSFQLKKIVCENLKVCLECFRCKDWNTRTTHALVFCIYSIPHLPPHRWASGPLVCSESAERHHSPPLVRDKVGMNFSFSTGRSCRVVFLFKKWRTLRSLDSLSSAVINTLPQLLGLGFRFIASFSFDSHHQTFPLDGILTTQEEYQCGWVSKKNKLIPRLCVDCSCVFF